MEEKIATLKDAAIADIDGAKSTAALNDIRIKYLGKKGTLTLLLRGMANLSADEKPRIGKLVNEARQCIETHLAARKEKLYYEETAAKLAAEKIDVTLPGRHGFIGNLHPLTLTLRRIKKIFLNMGFTVEEGPEIETDYYNFEALNLPKDHPARDMQDSFYITEDILMRTQTSPVQARTMEKASRREKHAPVRMIAPGRVYRRDDYDATHSPMFTQVEGLVIDKDITLADLKGTLELFLRQIFNDNVGVRFRPSFFPFTEPSAEVDVSCTACHGKGCRVCKGTGWLEILGSGMVHPHVLEMSGYDPKVVSGFAFGLGVERIAMLSMGLNDLRLFYDNDMRFLRQF